MNRGLVPKRKLCLLRRINMRTPAIKLVPCTDFETNIALINKIYASFEALEETLGGLKLEEPLFITYAAKKAFAKAVFNDISKNKKTKH